MPSAKTLRRDPALSGYLRAVRNSHRGYQQYGNLPGDDRRYSWLAARAVTRDQAVYDVHLHLSGNVSKLLGSLPAPPAAADWRRHRSALRDRWSSDGDLQRDLRNVRQNANGPVTAAQFDHLVTHAAAQFRQDIDDSTGLGRKAKRLARAQAWRRFNATLSALALASIAADRPSDESVRLVASGALR
jgi:hypothetical protein